ncbi:hypothetical protein [Brachybacterium sp. UMB0905]|uniref:SWIM zinc finger family protein n=1 Tax=Brachybacterium sp. UMB0905 TaxID=2069310 RepID=UPI000C7F9749|nr:hypothetical protein [Brachybacterium sp. UMB0905]PMC74834.1 hypothetical protein CJ197_11100 [Brachybacterium sp. UMB0905]
MSIRLRSRRGPVGKAWQATALREQIERLLGPGRIARGKADARAGRVQWLDVQTGAARGDVLDADGNLYQARIDVPPLRPGEATQVRRIARQHPELPARLAGGSYPEPVEEQLAAAQVPLLPRDASELSHDCSCLDWPGPCRHVSALVYVLVEAVDADPTLLLTLRGMSLADLVEEPQRPRAELPERPTGLDPTRLRPELLEAELGAEAAATLHAFFTEPHSERLQ